MRDKPINIISESREIYLKLPHLNLFNEVILSNEVSKVSVQRIVKSINRDGVNVIKQELPDGSIILKKVNPFKLNIYS